MQQPESQPVLLSALHELDANKMEGHAGMNSGQSKVVVGWTSATCVAVRRFVLGQQCAPAKVGKARPRLGAAMWRQAVPVWLQRRNQRRERAQLAQPWDRLALP